LDGELTGSPGQFLIKTPILYYSIEPRPTVCLWLSSGVFVCGMMGRFGSRKGKIIWVNQKNFVFNGGAATGWFRNDKGKETQ